MISNDGLHCCLCDGPINPGEPYVTTEAGIAHRFATTCSWHKEEAMRDCLASFDGDNNDLS